MAKIRLSKSELALQRNRLTLCRRLLPSLQLKRRQLTVELTRARRQQEAAEAEIATLDSKISADLPMLPAEDPSLLSGLVKVVDWELGEENVVGVELPVLASLRHEVSDYSLLEMPPWIDVLVQRLKGASQARLSLQIAAERVRILEGALRRVAQRVNLFEKILIPTITRNIKRIRIFLGDMERDAVVRAKLAKARQAGSRAVLLEERP